MKVKKYKYLIPIISIKAEGTLVHLIQRNILYKAKKVLGIKIPIEKIFQKDRGISAWKETAGHKQTKWRIVYIKDEDNNIRLGPVIQDKKLLKFLNKITNQNYAK